MLALSQAKGTPSKLSRQTRKGLRPASHQPSSSGSVPVPTGSDEVRRTGVTITPLWYRTAAPDWDRAKALIEPRDYRLHDRDGRHPDPNVATASQDIESAQCCQRGAGGRNARAWRVVMQELLAWSCGGQPRQKASLVAAISSIYCDVTVSRRYVTSRTFTARRVARRKGAELRSPPLKSCATGGAAVLQPC